MTVLERDARIDPALAAELAGVAGGIVGAHALHVKLRALSECGGVRH